MATFTAAQFRTAIKTRTRVTGTGTEWTDSEIDEAGRAAFNAVFPALYKKSIQSGLTVTPNSTTLLGTVTVTDATRVYKLIDTDLDEPVRGWTVKNDTTISQVPFWVTTVDVYSYAPINYDTVSPMTVPDEWPDVLYTFAELNLIEVIMGDKSTRLILPYTADEQTLGAVQANLYNKFERERDARAMGLPVVVV
jgi:hypothetical protein